MAPSRNPRPFLYALALNALALLPLLASGYLSDDIFNSLIAGPLLHEGKSPVAFAFDQSMHWLHEQGRFFPLAFSSYPVFYLLHDHLLLYKCCTLAVVLASFALFYLFLRRLTGSPRIPLIALLLLPLIVQFRAQWDPVLGFCAQYPAMAAMLFASLLLFLHWLESARPLHLAAAALLFLACALMYEVVYPLCLLYPAAAWTRLKRWPPALLRSLPFAAIPAALAAVSLFFRSRAPFLANGPYSPNLAPSAVLRGYAVHLFSALPFTYTLADPHGVFHASPRPIPSAAALPFALALCLAALAIAALRPRWPPAAALPHLRTAPAALSGALLLLIPPSLIALSPKYQAQPWGDAYLPVYFSFFGLATLAACLLSRLPSLPTPALPLAFLLFACNLRNNWIVAAAIHDSTAPRLLATRAIHRGLLRHLQPMDLFLLQGPNPWDLPDLYRMHAGIPLAAYPLDRPQDFTRAFLKAGAVCTPAGDSSRCDFPADAGAYALELRYTGEDAGAVFLARLRRAFLSHRMIQGLLATSAQIYLQFPPSSPAPNPAITGREPPSRIFLEPALHIPVADSGPLWKLLSLRRPALFDIAFLNWQLPSLSPPFSPSRDPSAFLLHAPGPDQLHAAFAPGQSQSGLRLPPVLFNPSASIHLLLRPAPSQPPNATIFSNHANGRGLVIEQVSGHPGLFEVLAGRGDGWMPLGRFPLEPGARACLSVFLSGRHSRISVNGNPVSAATLPAPIAESPLPVLLGNWISGDRPFHGDIEELLVSAQPHPDPCLLPPPPPPTPPAPTPPLLLSGPLPPLLHLASDGVFPWPRQSFLLPRTFSLEMLLRPFPSSQPPLATLLSNQAPRAGYYGIRIELSPAGTYHLLLGNGRLWTPAGSFSLPPGRRTSLALRVDGPSVRLSLDRRPVLSTTVPGASVPTSTPLSIGNWINRDRPFQGVIEEVRISPLLPENPKDPPTRVDNTPRK